ncbi:glycoside hydrolase family 76 protein [Armillaria luteobubalina]|uniref:Glycoside hydrolase family 76 protein n=1 Tax=Armillaria luteobubalina TaxID=153913 RepID=A0AA39QBS6_9AGAR|nr:glycoside hydrolase family 76 protein [Armillaria luteobubalina]
MISSLFLTLYFLHTVFAQEKCEKYVQAASTAASNLQSKYFTNNVDYGDQQPWISAVDVFYLGQLDKITGKQNYSNLINTVFSRSDIQDHLLNGQSYDDVQWVSIVYLQAGKRDEAKKFYDIASSAVDDTYCKGGLFWNGKRDYKNAITNELYMASSGYLYEVLRDEKYLTNLKQTYEWLNSTKMRGANGLFNDGLSNDGKCANTGDTQWTYNQGVILVGLGYLYKCILVFYLDSRDEKFLRDAFTIMDAIITHLTVDEGLRESCESLTQTSCNADQATFKGITMYYMAWFLTLTGEASRSKYTNFVKLQADKILENASGPEGWYSNLWYGKDQGGAQFTASSQVAALGALVAAGQQRCS